MVLRCSLVAEPSWVVFKRVKVKLAMRQQCQRVNNERCVLLQVVDVHFHEIVQAVLCMEGDLPALCWFGLACQH